MPQITMRAFLHGTTLKAAKDGVTPATVLKTILEGLFSATVVNGRTVISTSEAAGSTNFVLPDGLTPVEVMNLASEALIYVNAQSDPTNPILPGPVRRFRVTFDRAQL